MTKPNRALRKAQNVLLVVYSLSRTPGYFADICSKRHKTASWSVDVETDALKLNTAGLVRSCWSPCSNHRHNQDWSIPVARIHSMAKVGWPISRKTWEVCTWLGIAKIEVRLRVLVPNEVSTTRTKTRSEYSYTRSCQPSSGFRYMEPPATAQECFPGFRHRTSGCYSYYTRVQQAPRQRSLAALIAIRRKSMYLISSRTGL
jgi:hypothetical protein